MNGDILEGIFPRLMVNSYVITSPATPLYNCIAWAAEQDTTFWWPDPMGMYFWPAGVQREETLEAFAEVFRQLGYETCDDADLEPGYEKVTVFAGPAGNPTHAARQLPDGSWTSKMGNLEDIEHRRLKAVGGRLYGDPAFFLKRPIKH